MELRRLVAGATRLTLDCEAGPIIHRPRTELYDSGRDCAHQHRVPRYRSSGQCVVCLKNQAIARLGLKPSPGTSQMFSDYRSAVEAHVVKGGWLLRQPTNPVRYIVTSNERLVRLLRDEATLRWYDQMECWDEVELDSKRPAG